MLPAAERTSLGPPGEFVQEFVPGITGTPAFAAVRPREGRTIPANLQPDFNLFAVAIGETVTEVLRDGTGERENLLCQRWCRGCGGSLMRRFCTRSVRKRVEWCQCPMCSIGVDGVWAIQREIGLSPADRSLTVMKLIAFRESAHAVTSTEIVCVAPWQSVGKWEGNEISSGLQENVAVPKDGMEMQGGEPGNVRKQIHWIPSSAHQI